MTQPKPSRPGFIADSQQRQIGRQLLQLFHDFVDVVRKRANLRGFSISGIRYRHHNRILADVQSNKTYRTHGPVLPILALWFRSVPELSEILTYVSRDHWSFHFVYDQ